MESEARQPRRYAGLFNAYLDSKTVGIPRPVPCICRRGGWIAVVVETSVKPPSYLENAPGYKLRAVPGASPVAIAFWDYDVEFIILAKMGLRDTEQFIPGHSSHLDSITNCLPITVGATQLLSVNARAQFCGAWRRRSP